MDDNVLTCIWLRVNMNGVNVNIIEVCVCVSVYAEANSSAELLYALLHTGDIFQ